MPIKLLSLQENALTSYITLRRLVGVFGVALPIALPVGNWLRSGKFFESSISAYYYTEMRDVFVGTMWAFGVFLLAYQFGKVDNWLGNFAGVAAILVAVFPTAPDLAATGWTYVAGVVHHIAAAAFFICLAIFALFRFKLHRSGEVPRKNRTPVYSICGGVIALCLGLALAKFLVDVNRTDLPGWLGGISLFVLESVAIVAFGVSWFATGTGFRVGGAEESVEPRAQVTPVV